MQFAEAKSVDALSLERRDIAICPETTLPAPVEAFPGQDFDNFDRGLRPYHARRETAEGYVRFSPLTLSLYMLQNAFLIVAPQLNGVILTENHELVEEPSCFRERELTGPGMALPTFPRHAPFSHAFAGFDRSTSNHYHWLLYAISKSGLARPFLPRATPILLPDAEACIEPHRPVLPRGYHHETLRVSGLIPYVTPVSQGIYPVRQLYFMWHTPKMPELYLRVPQVHAEFDRFTTPRVAFLPKRFFISRAQSVDHRISAQDQTVIDHVLVAHEIATVSLDDMDVSTQIALFRGAELIIAPHGAGLANLAFARPGTAVLELNRQLDGQPHLRNCFYLLSAMRGLRYAMMDLTDAPLTIFQFQEALRRVTQS